jgi:MoxR-like ATPase
MTNANGRARRVGPARATRRAAAGVLTTKTFGDRFERVVNNINQVIKGKDEVIRLAITALLADGHVLFEDYPGTGKTMLARAIATSMNAESSRIQCAPDLLPADITGSPVLDRKSGEFVFRPGPVFANVLLADEINRATPKTQAALLEAMAERTVTVERTTHLLPSPFFVLATENPVELAGTFPLPEAQLDRFLFKLSMGYADRDAEWALMQANRQKAAIHTLGPVIDVPEIVEMIEFCTSVSVSDPVGYYIVDLVQATRNDPALQMGASSRASQALMHASRVIAASQGRDDVIPDDVARIMLPVLGHRLILTPDAMLRDETVEGVLERILTRVKVPMGLAGSRSKTRVVETALEAQPAVGESLDVRVEVAAAR